MIALDRCLRGTLYSFFSCSLICTIMDERTERYDKFFLIFFISWMRFYKKSVVKYLNDF